MRAALSYRHQSLIEKLVKQGAIKSFTAYHSHPRALSASMKEIFNDPAVVINAWGHFRSLGGGFL